MYRSVMINHAAICYASGSNLLRFLFPFVISYLQFSCQALGLCFCLFAFLIVEELAMKLYSVFKPRSSIKKLEPCVLNHNVKYWLAPPSSQFS